MPLNDFRLVGLLQIVLVQEKELLELKAQIVSLSRLAVEAYGTRAADLLTEARAEFLQKATGSQASIRALEETIAELLPPPNSQN